LRCKITDFFFSVKVFCEKNHASWLPGYF